MPKVSFDGENRRIYVLSRVSELDVEMDLYSEWKRWLVNDVENLKYAPAFRTVGGDPIGGGKVSPKYFFLVNGWRVVIDGQTVVVSMNLYTEEGDSPFIVLNNGAVISKGSDVPVVGMEETLSEVREIKEKVREIDVDMDVVIDLADFLVQVVKNRKYLKKGVDGRWYLVVRNKDDTGVLMRKLLLDVEGNNIADIQKGILAEEVPVD